MNCKRASHTPEVVYDTSRLVTFVNRRWMTALWNYRHVAGMPLASGLVSQAMSVAIRYLGGPTALIEIGGVRLLTDPTFDPPGDYPIGSRLLTKMDGAVAEAGELGAVDAVLLSHDQHPDNLDLGGRSFIGEAELALSTRQAAERLDGAVRGLAPWQSVDLGDLTVTAVPAQHGPDGCEPVTGPVTGFVLHAPGVPRVYVSGDNASLDVVRAIAERVGDCGIAVLFAGAARTALLDGAALTLGSAGAAAAARLVGAAHVVPLHFEGWAHFTEGRDTLPAAFSAAGLADRLRLLSPGQRWTLPG